MYQYVCICAATHIHLDLGWDGYNKISIVIADGVNLFLLEFLDGRK